MGENIYYSCVYSYQLSMKFCVWHVSYPFSFSLQHIPFDGDRRLSEYEMLPTSSRSLWEAETTVNVGASFPPFHLAKCNMVKWLFHVFKLDVWSNKQSIRHISVKLENIIIIIMRRSPSSPPLALYIIAWIWKCTSFVHTYIELCTLLVRYISFCRTHNTLASLSSACSFSVGDGKKKNIVYAWVEGKWSDIFFEEWEREVKAYIHNFHRQVDSLY